MRLSFNEVNPPMPAKCFLVLVLGAALSGCATLVHGTSQRIPVTSSPQGARVLVDSVPIGVTPLVASVSRKESHVVSIVHDSFPAVHVALDRKLSPWVLGNLYLLYLPAIVDFSTGAAYGFARDTLTAVFPGRAVQNVAAQPAGIRRTTPIPDASRVTAAVFSVAVGFGSGHAMIGAPAKPFLATQLGGMGVASLGLGLAFSGQKGGRPLFWTGAGLFVGSRVWEVIDIFTRTAKHNRGLEERDR